MHVYVWKRVHLWIYQGRKTKYWRGTLNWKAACSKAYSSDAFITKTSTTLARYTHPSTMASTQYAKVLITKLRCKLFDKGILIIIFMKGLDESLPHGVWYYLRTQRGSVLYDLARQVTSLQALQNLSDAQSEKNSDYRQSSNHRHSRRGNSQIIVTFIRAGGSIPTATATPEAIALAVMRIGSSPPSISTPTAPSIKEINAVYVDSTAFCRVSLEEKNCQAQCPFIQSHIWKGFAVQFESNLNDLLLTPQMILGYQPASAKRTSQVPQQVPAQ